MIAKKTTYFNYDANTATQDVQSASNLISGGLGCVDNPPLCVLNGLTDTVNLGFQFYNNEQNRQLITQQLSDQDYMIQQGYSFQEWAAKTKEGIINTTLKGQLMVTRLSQKSDIYITSLLRNYYINKTTQIKQQNIEQINKLKPIIISGVILVFLLGAAIFLTEEI